MLGKRVLLYDFISWYNWNYRETRYIIFKELFGFREGILPNNHTGYDIIIGAVANDDVFKTVDMYFRDIWSKQKALDELRYYKMNDQICIINQDVLDKELIFRKAYQVSEDDK